MSKDKTKIDVLDELNKGACMGKDAIKFIIDKVEDKSLKKELNNQYKEYKIISEKIEKIYSKYNEESPHKTSNINKIMTWYGIEMKTFLDCDTSKIAELLIQGTNMGIIEGRKLLNHKETNAEINKLVEEYVNMQEKAVEILKKFL